MSPLSAVSSSSLLNSDVPEGDLRGRRCLCGCRLSWDACYFFWLGQRAKHNRPEGRNGACCRAAGQILLKSHPSHWKTDKGVRFCPCVCRGSAVANSLSEIIACLLLFGYIRWRKLHSETWGGDGHTRVRTAEPGRPQGAASNPCCQPHQVGPQSVCRSGGPT